MGIFTDEFQWIKVCEMCNNTQTYKSYKQFWRANKNKSLCKSCRPKTKEQRRKQSISHIGYVKTEEHRSNLSKSLLGNKLSDETKKKISIAHKNNPVRYWLGKSRSVDTIVKLRTSTKNRWLRGNFKQIYKSKGEIDAANTLIQIGYEIEIQKFINGKPYDIYIPILNTIIEFNGTYWHLDPRKYASDYWDKSRKISAVDVWRRDKEKINSAIDGGFVVIIIWQYDWELAENKINFLKDIINESRSGN